MCKKALSVRTPKACGMFGEFYEVLRAKRDLLVVASDELDCSSPREVRVYLFEVGSAPGVAGGRAGGYGSRKITSVRGYLVRGAQSAKFYETVDDEAIGRFEIPHYATAMDVPLPDGSTVVVRGVVDPELVSQYDSLVQG